MAYLPISVNAIFDRFGNPYNTSSIIGSDGRLDISAYGEYSPLYFPSTYVVVYCLCFTIATALIAHTILFHGSDIWNITKDIKQAQTDIHAKLMLRYKEVPTYWYGIIFVLCACMAVGLNEVSPCQRMPLNFVSSFASRDITLVSLSGDYSSPSW